MGNEGVSLPEVNDVWLIGVANMPRCDRGVAIDERPRIHTIESA